MTVLYNGGKGEKEIIKRKINEQQMCREDLRVQPESNNKGKYKENPKSHRQAPRLQ